VGLVVFRIVAATEKMYDTSLCFEKNVTETNFHGRSTMVNYKSYLLRVTGRGSFKWALGSKKRRGLQY